MRRTDPFVKPAGDDRSLCILTVHVSALRVSLVGQSGPARRAHSSPFCGRPSSAPTAPGDIEPPFDQRLDAVGDRHVDAAVTRHFRQRESREGAFRELSRLRLRDRFAPSEREPEGEITQLGG